MNAGRLRRAIASVVGLAIVCSAASLAAPALVYASCDPGRPDTPGVYYWGAATQFPGTSVTGVSSYIFNYDPFVNPKGGFSYSWVMLANSQISGTWAQVGNYKNNQNRYVYIQWRDRSSLPVVQLFFPARTVNTFTTYNIGFASSTFSFYAGGTLLATHNPGTTPWTPDNAQLASEITSQMEQMMGARTNTVEFTLNKLQYGGSWRSVTGTPYTAPANTFVGVSGNGGDFVTWDEACAS